MDGKVIANALDDLREQLKKSPPNNCNWMHTIDSLIGIIKDQQTMIDELREEIEKNAPPKRLRNSLL